MRKILLVVACAVVISGVVHGLAISKIIPWHIGYSDTAGFFERVSQPGFPYIDILMEYPVLIGVLVGVIGKISSTQAIYFILNVIVLLGFALGTTYYLWRLVPEQNRDRLMWFWALAPSMLWFSVFNWDLMAIFFSVLAFYCIHLKRDRWAAAWIAFGFSAKFFPILFLVPLLIRQRDMKEVFRLIFIFVALAFLINGYFMLFHFDNWSYFFELNRIREPNTDSIWNVMRSLLYPMFEKENLAFFNSASFLGFLVTFTWIMRKFRAADTLKLCFASVLVFLLFNKIFSPQYILWLLPFLTLYPVFSRRKFYMLEAANLGALFTVLILFFVDRSPAYFYWNMFFVVLRHVLLIILFVSLVQLLSQKEKLTRR